MNRKSKGQGIILALIIVNLLASVAATVYVSAFGVQGALPQQLIHLVLSVIFFYSLYRGVPWVRIAAIVLFVISGMTGIAGGFWMLFMLVAEPYVYILFGMSLIHLISAAVLLFSPPVKAYFQTEVLSE